MAETQSDQPTFIATVQLVIRNKDVASQAEACDWVSGLLDEATTQGLLDWAYLNIGGQLLKPSDVQLPERYKEGDAWR